MSGPAARGAADQVRVSVMVRVPLASAFELFTAEIDRWWRRGSKFRQASLAHRHERAEGNLLMTIETRDLAQSRLAAFT